MAKRSPEEVKKVPELSVAGDTVIWRNGQSIIAARMIPDGLFGGWRPEVTRLDVKLTHENLHEDRGQGDD